MVVQGGRASMQQAPGAKRPTRSRHQAAESSIASAGGVLHAPCPAVFSVATCSSLVTCSWWRCMHFSSSVALAKEGLRELAEWLMRARYVSSLACDATLFFFHFPPFLPPGPPPALPTLPWLTAAVCPCRPCRRRRRRRRPRPAPLCPPQTAPPATRKHDGGGVTDGAFRLRSEQARQPARHPPLRLFKGHTHTHAHTRHSPALPAFPAVLSSR